LRRTGRSYGSGWAWGGRGTTRHGWRCAAAGEPVARSGAAVQRVRAEHVAARERPKGSVRRKWVPPRTDRRALACLGVRARGKPRRCAMHGVAHDARAGAVGSN
jgi:hypothetical protein